MRSTRLLLALIAAVALARGAHAQRSAPLRASTRAALDSVARAFWQAAVAGDSVALERLTTGRQPRDAVYVFTFGSDAATTGAVERFRPIDDPPTEVCADTVFRSYAVWLSTDMVSGWGAVVLRFERHGRAWRIALLAPAPTDSKRP